MLAVLRRVEGEPRSSFGALEGTVSGRLTRTALPEARYLSLVGQLVYEVGSIEWLILGDIAGELNRQGRSNELAKLAGSPTSRLGQRLQAIAATLGAYEPLACKGGAILVEVAGLRNAVLHARPATDSDGSQRLYRWAPTKEEPFIVSVDELEGRIRQVGEWSSELEKLRPRDDR